MGVQGVTNLVIVFDRSGSMDGNPNFESFRERLDLAKAAVALLIEAYEDQGGVNVLVVDFSSGAATSGWTSATGANAYLAGLEASGSTNYEAAIALTQSEFVNGTPLADQNIVYFLSDGEPTTRTNDGTNDGGGNAGDSDGLTNDEVDAWETFLALNSISLAFGVGMGSGADESELEEIAFPNGGAQSLVATDQSFIDDLLNTFPLQPVIGNLLTDTTADSFGADGPGAPRILSIMHNSVTYNYNGTDVTPRAPSLSSPAC